MAVMRPSTALAFAAAGAIACFAVGSSPSFMNLHIAGVILMATGAAGCWLGRGNGWLVSWLRTVLLALSPAAGPGRQRVPIAVLLSSQMFEPHPPGTIASSGPPVPGGGDHDAGSCHAPDDDGGARPRPVR